MLTGFLEIQEVLRRQRIFIGRASGMLSRQSEEAWKQLIFIIWSRSVRHETLVSIMKDSLC
jgi:hypothetical protein